MSLTYGNLLQTRPAKVSIVGGKTNAPRKRYFAQEELFYGQALPDAFQSVFVS